jgi:hypothetical protein
MHNSCFVKNLLFSSRKDLPLDHDGLKLSEIYESLPKFHKGLIQHHKDAQEVLIAIYSVINTSAALIPNVYVNYDGKRSFAFLFLLLLLPPANGKGAMSLSRILLREINRLLTKVYEDAQKRYQHHYPMSKKGGKSGASALSPPPPKLQQILIAGNTTSARLILQFSDNGEYIPLHIIESEADALTGMFSGEMGAQNSSIFRQGFHHEAISSARKGNNETLHAERPKLALLISGTENQVSSLFKGNEDGLFSRFLVLDLVGNMQWKTPRPREGVEPIEQYYVEYAHKFLKLWHQTQKLNLEVKFSKEQWDLLDKTGVRLQRIAHLVGGGYAIGIARRHLLMATRICTVLTFFRHIDPEDCRVPSFTGSISVSDIDWNTSLQLMEYSFNKALALFQRMPSPTPIKSNNVRQLNFFAALPVDFCMADAIELANKMKIPTRTKDRYLSEFIQTGALEKIGRGHYKKSLVAEMALAEGTVTNNQHSTT